MSMFRVSRATLADRVVAEARAYAEWRNRKGPNEPGEEEARVRGLLAAVGALEEFINKETKKSRSGA